MSPRRPWYAFGLFVVCVTPLILFHSLSLLVLDLLNGPIRGIFVGGAVVGAALTIGVFIQERRSVLAAVVSLLVAGVLAVAIVYGSVWFAWRFVRGTPLLTRPAPPTQQPEPSAVVTTAPEVPVGPAAGAAQPPAAGQTCGEAVVSGVDALVIRAAPGLSSPRLGARQAGTVVQLLCDTQIDADGLRWQHVRSGDTEGWMGSQYLQPPSTQGE